MYNCDWKNGFGADLNGTSGTGSVFGSNALGPGENNGNVNIGSGNSGGNTTLGDITVDTGNDFNFFFADPPDITAESGSFLSSVFDLFSGIFGSVFGSNALGPGENNGNVNIGSGNSGGNTTLGDITVDTGNDFNFFFGSSPLVPTEVA